MSKLVFLTLPLLLAAALSGCGDKAPQGILQAVTYEQPIAGSSIHFHYQPQVHPIRDLVGGTDVPVVGCLANNLPEGLADDFVCIEASTNITAQLSLPKPDEKGYQVWLTSEKGAQALLGVLTPDDASVNPQTFSFHFDIAEDFTGKYDHAQIRMDQFVYLEAGVAEGDNAFAYSELNKAVSVQAAFKGVELNVGVAGLQSNVTYTGYLYRTGEDGVLAPVYTFEGIQAGANNLTAPEDINRYEEFHVHVSDSKVNVAKLILPAQ